MSTPLSCAGDLAAVVGEAASTLRTLDGFDTILTRQLREVETKLTDEDFWTREYPAVRARREAFELVTEPGHIAELREAAHEYDGAEETAYERGHATSAASYKASAKALRAIADALETLGATTPQETR